jgi:hypothetical protein
MEYGSIWLGTKAAVRARASAGVVGGEKMGNIPPFCRKLGVFAVRLVSMVVANWGGRDRIPKLSYRTSYASPKPARIDVVPLVPGE